MSKVMTAMAATLITPSAIHLSARRRAAPLGADSAGRPRGGSTVTSRDYHDGSQGRAIRPRLAQQQRPIPIKHSSSDERTRDPDYPG
jgi:hypothetical protein